MDFETTTTGMSLTTPMQASSLRKGSVVMLKGNPCKIVDMSTSKTGKHGHAKVNFVGVDIFTGKKYEDMCPSTHNMDVPVVKKDEWQVLDIQSDGFLSLLGSDNETQKEDLKVPVDEKLSQDIRGKFEAGESFVVIVQSAMGTEQIIGVKRIDV